MSTPTAPSPSSSPPPPSSASSPPPTASSPPPPDATSPPPPVTASPPTISSSPPPPASASPPPPPSSSESSPPPPSSSESSPPPPSSTSRSPPPPPPSSTSRSPPPPASSSKSPPPPSSSSASPPPPPTSSSSSSGVSTGLVVGVVVGGVVVLAFLLLVLLCCKKKRRRDHRREDYYPPPPTGPKNGGGQQQHQQGPMPGDHVVMMIPKPSPPHPSAPTPPYSSNSGGSNYSVPGNNALLPLAPGISLGFGQSTFSYEELSMATDGFSDANILGQGGFGYVHRGVLPNGKEVAVKSLKAGSGQGEREFRAEVEIISRVHHKHLVSLVGYCITGTHRMLVYDFVANNTMEFHLHGEGRPTMDWPSRLSIALGSAKGLAYLHEDCHPKIIHRDIKAANILLDFNFEAKVADFGLAKNTEDMNTHVSTRVMGTFGYLAPEYAASGKLTEKSDVFSYGVVLLELITGRRPVDTTNTYMDDSLVDWARPILTKALEEGNYDALVDPKLQRNYNKHELERMVTCAAACVRHSSRRRPKMSQVVRALEGNASLSDLNEGGVKPGYSSVYSSNGSTDYDHNQYNEDMKKFRKMALASQEYSSGGYSTSGVSSSDSAGQTTQMVNNKEHD